MYNEYDDEICSLLLSGSERQECMQHQRHQLSVSVNHTPCHICVCVYVYMIDYYTYDNEK